MDGMGDSDEAGIGTAVALVPEVDPSALRDTGEALAAIAARAQGFADGARAANTRKAYGSDWQHFAAWCAAHALADLPAAPTTVELYLAAHADTLAMATLTRRLSAVATTHRLAEHSMDTRHPAIRDVMRGLRRAKGVAQRHAEALTLPLLLRLLATCGDRLLDHRDRALLLVGFAAALRRSELVGFDLGDVAVLPEGLRLTIRRSKGDQEGEGQVIGVGRTDGATCPATAVTAWLVAAGITEGAVFLSVDRRRRVGARLSTVAVSGTIQRRAALAGLDPARFSGHSLRAGLATSGAQCEH
jgi:site-specific recombinase XerD